VETLLHSPHFIKRYFFGACNAIYIIDCNLLIKSMIWPHTITNCGNCNSQCKVTILRRIECASTSYFCLSRASYCWSLSKN